MRSSSITSRNETPLFFPAGDDVLFGIYTRPEAGGSLAAITLSGGGATAPATNRNRLGVYLCRSLAEIGYTTMRFDYHGIGESAGVLAGAPKVDEPYLEDVTGAVTWMRDQAVDRFILIGSCFGARTALSYGPTLDGLEAMVLVSPPLQDIEMKDEAGTRLAEKVTVRASIRRALRFRTIKGLMHPGHRHTYFRFVRLKTRAALTRARGRLGKPVPADDAWVSDHFLDPIRTLAERGIPVLFLYGAEDWHYRDFDRATRGRLGAILDSAPSIDVMVMDGEVHGLIEVETQRRVAEIVLDWLPRKAPAV